MKNLLLYSAILIIFFSSCKKIIEVDTNNAQPQIVIEGQISDQLTDQKIIISKSVGYSEPGVYPKISGAVVTVNDDKGSRYTFTEKTPGVYVQAMRGVPGNTYNMSVTIDGKTYTASSKMPNLIKLDSIGIESNNFFGKERKNAAAYLSDPANEINFYRFNLYVNNIISNRIYVNNDRLTNGNKLRIQLFYGTDDEDNDGLKSGDQITVEAESIDTHVFDYWYSLSQQTGRGPNQGTTPANPPSNISNGALGYFSAHSYLRKSITVK